jgi:hypothetical protein
MMKQIGQNNILGSLHIVNTILTTKYNQMVIDHLHTIRYHNIPHNEGGKQVKNRKGQNGLL